MIVTTQVAANREERALCAILALAKRGLGRGPTDQIVLRMLGVLGALMLGLIVTFGLAACAPEPPPPEQAIVGQWVNSEGGIIYFYADKTGFIPGDEGHTPPIPSLRFSYYFEDETHLGIRMDGQSPLVIEIKLEGDKMTWYDYANEIEFEYMRVK